MARKSKSPKKKAQPVEKVTQTNPPAASAEEENKPFDFGGLPDRNLKKNLGCG